MTPDTTRDGAGEPVGRAGEPLTPKEVAARWRVSSDGRIMRLERVCEQCGTTYWTRDRRRRFCSRSCGQRSRAPRPAGERFWTHVDMSLGPEGCWPWTARLSPAGYGHTSRICGTTLAHRVAWYLSHGSVPAGLSLDHLCRNTRCVNPAHLDPVPQAVNRARVVRGPVIPVTHCRQGHPFDEDNTREYMRHGRRYRACRACNRAAVSRYRASQR
jgi:hypothetical protein